jgi:hypothetical protein
MVGCDQRQREGHASLEFKAKKGGGLAIVAAKPKKGKGHTSDRASRGEINSEELEVAEAEEEKSSHFPNTVTTLGIEGRGQGEARSSPEQMWPKASLGEIDPSGTEVAEGKPESDAEGTSVGAERPPKPDLSNATLEKFKGEKASLEARLLIAPKPRKGGDCADQELESRAEGASGGAESPPKPGLIKALLDNGITACNDGGWQTASEASHTSRTTATSGGEDNDVYADKRRHVIKQLQAVLAESDGNFKTTGFGKILGEAASLFGDTEARRIKLEVLEARLEKYANAISEEPKGKACSRKRAKGKTSQRKGYG